MNRPLRLAVWFVGVFGVFATYFVAVSCIFHGVFVAFWQTVSNVISSPFAAVGDRFIVPTYT